MMHQYSLHFIQAVLLMMVTFLTVNAQSPLLDVDGDAKIVGRLELGKNFNTLVGISAGNNSLSGTHNSAFGLFSGFSLASGSRNTFAGSGAGQFIRSSNDNTFFGNNAGQLYTGFRNSLFGSGAGTGTVVNGTSGANNCFFGHNAGHKVQNARDNAFFGTWAGEETTSGRFNCYFGIGAGRQNLSGMGNIFIGANAGENELGSDKLYIENTSSANPLIYGDFSSKVLKFNGKLGVGNILPATELHIRHSDGVGGSRGLRIENSGTNGHWWAMHTWNSNGRLVLYSKDGASNGVGAFFPNSGDYSSLSDRRAKKNFVEVPPLTKKVMQLNVKRYHYRSEDDEAQSHIGLIAQDLMAVFPEYVDYDSDQDRYFVNYAGLSAVALKVIQEQQRQLENQEEIIIDLDRRLRALEDKE